MQSLETYMNQRNILNYETYTILRQEKNTQNKSGTTETKSQKQNSAKCFKFRVELSFYGM